MVTAKPTSQQKGKQAESFADLCRSAYECWQMHKIMCGYEIKDNSGIWGRFGIILHHYLILQIAKINDREKYGKDYNFSLEYFVASVDKPSYTDFYNKFLEDNKKFRKAINNARRKVIAHRDLKVFNSPNAVGAFPAGLDEKYFDSLHKIISEGYRELGLGFFPEWPPFIIEDTKNFMEKMLKIFNA